MVSIFKSFFAQLGLVERAEAILVLISTRAYKVMEEKARREIYMYKSKLTSNICMYTVQYNDHSVVAYWA